MLKRPKFKKTHRGATLIEYVLIASLITLALVGAYKSVGTGYSRIYNNIDKALP